MIQRPRSPRLLCCASIFALSLCSCSQHTGTVKSGSNLSESEAIESTASGKKYRIFHVSRNGARKSLISKKLGAGGKHYDNLWDRLFDLYDLPQIEHSDIEQEVEWFINHPDYIDRVQTRAEPFLYNIVRHIEKQGVPGEIALLPVIESAFQPKVISPANAAGIWQFIPETGRRYGLKQNHHYDGRRDVYASTRAAVKYLKKLHKQFNGDWLLAIAAYNCGEGAVDRAIQKNNARGYATDFWSLDLPSETRSYVPRLLAVSRVFGDSEQYGINLHPIPNHALYKTIKVKSQLDLALAADVADLSVDQLIALNPGFKSHRADVEGGYRLFVPAEKYKTFKEELSRLTEQTATLTSQPDALSPDTVSDASNESDDDKRSMDKRKSIHEQASKHDKAYAKLADRRHVKEEKLATAMRHGDNRQRVREELSISAKTAKNNNSAERLSSSLSTDKHIAALPVARQAQDKAISGHDHKESGKSLAKINATASLADKDVGKKLTLAKTGAGIKPSQSLHYTVKQGDSLFGITRKFNVSIADLRKWNGTKLEKQFKPGMNLTVSNEKD